MKKLSFLTIIFIIGFLFIGNIKADYCTECAAQNGDRCGLCGYSCHRNDEGVCVVNNNFGVSTESPQKNQELGSCMGYTYQDSCENNPFYSCIWNETEYGNYCNTDTLLYVACGDSFDIPYQAPEIISFLVNLLKIATPIILIFVSVITLFKAIVASKEDEIKKAQSSLINKIIASVMVFFVISIVQFVISKVADSSEQGGIESCLSCFLNNSCENSVYYKTNVGGTYICTYIDGGGTFTCKGNK